MLPSRQQVYHIKARLRHQGSRLDDRIEIVYVSREEFAAERMEEPEGKYFVVIHGERYGGGRWEFRQAELDFLVAEALRNGPAQSN